MTQEGGYRAARAAKNDNINKQRIKTTRFKNKEMWLTLFHTQPEQPTTG